VNTPAPADFRNAWLTAAKSVGSLYGPDGRFDPARYDAVARSLVQVYRGRGEQFEILLIPYLIYRDGAVVGQSVQWDGVARHLPFEYANRDVTHMESRRGLKAACISLRVVAYDADGNRLFETYGGLEVAVRMKLAEGRWTWTERGDLFRDRDDLEEGTRVALKPLLRR
jgi:hypothetical protein